MPILKFTPFTGIDIRSIAAFRITLGLMLLIDMVLHKIPYMQVYYTDSGLFSLDTLIKITPEKWCTLLNYISNDGGVIVFFSMSFIVILLFTLGFRTTWTSVLTFIYVLSITQRTPFVAGGDMVFRAAVFWSMFLPLNGAFTLFKSKETLNSKFIIKDVAAFAILFQISLIYFFNAFTKNGSTWKDGTAVAFASMIGVHKGPFADGLISSPFLYTILTYLTLAFEYAIPLLIFSPIKNNTTRIVGFFLIIIFHWGNLFFLQVGNFCLATFPLAFILIPGKVWDKIITSLPENKKIIVKNKFHLQIMKKIVIIFFIIVVLCINIETLLNKNKVNPNNLRVKTSDYFGLYQRWQLFAPEPTKVNGYTLVLGKLEDGTRVNLYGNQKFYNHTLKKHPYFYNTIPYMMYFASIYMRDLKDFPVGQNIGKRWAKYEFQRWNKKNSGNELKNVQVCFVGFFSISPGVVTAPELKVLYEYQY